MPEKPPRRLPGEWQDDDHGDDVPHSGAGRLAEDERGNVTWQRVEDDSLLADDTAGANERLRTLVDPSLDIVEEDPLPHHVFENTRGVKAGYDPYSSGSLVKPERKKKMSLRELSKWIETKRKVEQGSSGGSDK